MRTHNSECRCHTCNADRLAPSPAEIAEQCEAFQRCWSAAERVKRVADDSTRWNLTEHVETPLVSLDSFQALTDGGNGGTWWE